MKKHLQIPAIIILLLAWSSCSHRTEIFIPGEEAPPAVEDSSMIVADCAKPQGPLMRIAQGNGSSTTSPVPGAPAAAWLKGLHNKLTRVWIQLVFIYNNGDINYNYTYSGSRVKVEDALSFYSSTSDSLLIVLSGHKKSGSYNMPVGAAYADFVKETVLYFKRKFPKIQYIQVSNEPDAGDETMETYYPVYRYYYQGINAANEILAGEYRLQGKSYHPLLISNGAFTSNITNMLAYTDGFLKAYVQDPDPGKKLDFFTFNSYGEANRPRELQQAKTRIDSAMQSNGLPLIPAIVSEYGIEGGSGLPGGFDLRQTMVLQAPGQLTKAFYLYEGGISSVLNWLVHHSSIAYKSELLDVANGIPSPYGHALMLSEMLAAHKQRIRSVSKGIDSMGLGIHSLAAADNRGVAVLVWNYNWRTIVPEREIRVLVKNIPLSLRRQGGLRCKIYRVDADHNNYYNHPEQTSLSVTREMDMPPRPHLQIPLTLQSSAVALIVLTPGRPG